MGWYWNPLGLLGLTNVALAWTLAVVVYATRPDRRENRLLALLLALEGAFYAGGAGIIYLTEDPDVAFAAQATTEFFSPAVTVGYFLLLSTLATPLARPLRSRAATALLAGALAVLPFAVLWRVDLFVAGVEPVSYARWEAVEGPWNQPVDVVRALVVLVGVALALDAWRRAAPGSSERSSAAAYALAFGFRDATFASSQLLWFTGVVDPGVRQATLHVLLVAYYLLLAFGILRRQLLGIDVKVRWTISKTTIAAAFVAAFFVASEAAQQFFGETLGSAYVGILAAGALVFAIAPLSRLADRLAEKAVPVLEPAEDGARTVARREEAYRAAIRLALRDRRLSREEERQLLALAEELGIPAGRAAALHEEIEEEGEAKGRPA